MKKLLVAACLMALTLPSLSANDQRARVLLQAAEAKAKVEGDLNAAIKLYKDAEKEAGANRALVAQALVKMAEAYQKLGDAEAQKIYRRVVSEFSDQKEPAATAQARLVPSSPRVTTGATLRDVTDLNKSGNVSADGRLATYVNWETGNIGVRDLMSGTSREVTARSDYVTYEPRLSRDGKFVAYVSYNGCVERKFEGARAALCVIGVEGEPATVARTIVERAEISDITPVDWSPDGRSIAVNLRRQDGAAQIGVANVADGSVRVLQSTDWRGATRIFFSPDGRYVAFDVPVDDSSDYMDIRVVAVDGSTGSTIIHDPSQNVVMGWTADGRHLLFASDRTGVMSLWAQRVTDVKADGSPRLVHPGLGGALSLGLTKTGSLYFGVQSGDVDVEILTLDLKSGKSLSSPVRPIARYVGTNGRPQWSRDGKFLAYLSERGVTGKGRIIGIRESVTGAIRELRPNLTYLENLSWSPDGNTLVTNGTDLKGRKGIFTIDVRTGELTHLGQGRFPKFAPEGDRLFYITPGSAPPNSLVERDLRSGAERTIITGDIATFSVSPDGRSFAVARGGVSNAMAHEVVIVAGDTGQVRQLYRVPQGERVPPYNAMAFTPDGQGVLMRKMLPSEELWVLPVDGGPARKVDAQIAGWTFGTAGGPSLHPDGRQLAGTRRRENPSVEVRVLENFLASLK